MKKFKRVSTKKGFTLVELVVTVGVLSLVAGMGVGIVASAIRNYSTASTTYTEQNVAMSVESFLVDALRTTKKVEKLTPLEISNTESARYLYFENGKLVTSYSTVETKGQDPVTVNMYYERVKSISVTLKRTKAEKHSIQNGCFLQASYNITMYDGYEINGSTVMINADALSFNFVNNENEYADSLGAYSISYDPDATSVSDGTNSNSDAIKIFVN